MLELRQIVAYLELFAPPALAEEWDNVGLLLGDVEAPVQRLMTCLTVTPDSAAEAIQERAELVVTHHPLPFRPLQRLTTDSTAGRLLWQLARAGIAVYSPHTSFDSTTRGINQQLAEGLGLQSVAPLRQAADNPSLGGGRYGKLPEPRPLKQVARTLKEFLSIEHLDAVGDEDLIVQQVAVACGSAGEFLAEAQATGCQLLVTGETSFHTCLEAEARGIALLLPGHFASERFALETLATQLQQQFPNLEVWASRRERDCLKRW